MLNKPNSHSEYTIQNEVTQYPVGFEFFFNGDDTPQVLVKIGGVKMDLNVHYKFSEDLSTLVLIPLEEEKPTDPNDYSWMNKWLGQQLEIERDIEFVQESDYQVGRISPEQIEKDFDASVMRDQILLDKIGEHTTDVSEELESLHTDIYVINAELATKVTKAELDNYKLAANAAIDANATAIQKTREDYISADSEIHKILNSHTSELTTLRGNQASLGVQVSNIEHKIPESASGSNPLITKQQLLDEEMDIRKDLNSGLSELQTQVTAQAAKIETKQNKLTAGDNIIISGNVISATGTGGAGFDAIVVQELPESGLKGVIYLVPSDGETPDVYDEYLWIESTGTFELIGKTKVDLSDYATKVDLSNYLPLSGGTLTAPLGFDVTGSAYSYVPIIVTSDGTSAISIQSNGSGKLTNGYIHVENLNVRGTLSVNTIGNGYVPAQKIYVKQIGSGKDASLLNVPDGTGTLARLEDLENIDALPDQTGNAGKFLVTNGSEASWEDVPPSVTITLKEYDE